MMMRWMCGVSLKDRKRSEDLCSFLGIQCVADVRHDRLRWSIPRRDDGSDKPSAVDRVSLNIGTHSDSNQGPPGSARIAAGDIPRTGTLHPLHWFVK